MNVPVEVYLKFARENCTQKVVDSLTRQFEGVECINTSLALSLLREEIIKNQTPQPNPSLIRLTSRPIVEEGFTPEMENTLLGLNSSNS